MKKKETALVLGGSRGLGQALAEGLKAQTLSRSQGGLDLSEPDSFKKIKALLSETPFDTIIYSAGGGPHGFFFSKPPKAHRWALELNLLRPLEIAYHLKSRGFKGVFVYIGSAIAERSLSLKSLSYSYSKKMSVKSLLSLKEKELRVRVFSPPYMNTALLPKNSWPRLETPHLVLEPRHVAQALLGWLKDGSTSPSQSASQSASQNGGFDPRHFDWMDRFSYTLPKEKEF